MTGHGTLAALVLMASISRPDDVRAQSLAILAAQTAAVPPSGRSRVYTNADLDESEAVVTPVRGDAVETHPTPAAKEPAVVYEEIAGAGRVNMKTTTKLPDPRDETYWRTSAAHLRKNLAKTHATIAAQTEQLAAVGQGPPSPSHARQREVITDTLDELSRHARAQNDEWARFITKAQMAGVPDAWVAEESPKN
jgi:hypothetical protein